MGKLDGKIAFLTGAATGMGRAMAHRFAQEGADIAIADSNEAEMEVTADLVRSCGRRALVQPCDVSKPNDIRKMVVATVAQFGRVDVAVANAGIVETDTDCLLMSEAQWDRTLGVNLKGVFFTLQAAAKQMIEQGRGGRLLATASIMAEWGSAAGPAYAASKGGVRQVVRSFALACGRHGITCNAIAPGFIATPMTRMLMDDAQKTAYLVSHTPIGRFGQPEDVAGLAAFLASDEAGFITGAMVVADGGVTAGLYNAAVPTLVGRQPAAKE